MVLIAASVCTKNGKVLVSRQFVEMSKARIEGLLAAFPKLVSAGKQHTFVETDSVRYVYQPMEKVYMLLVTTKTSNILEDLETLRLFSRVIPEYCRSMEEREITENAFNLIFAFDEIVTMGYRENVNLAQIRTFVEMDSHEEKVYQAVRQTQEREAKNKMREKAKELQRQRMEAAKKGLKGTSSIGYNISPITSSTNYITGAISSDVSMNMDTKKIQFPNVPKINAQGKSLKLGGKAKNIESFVDQLKSEGEIVSAVVNMKISADKFIPSGIDYAPANIEEVHIKREERMIVKINKDGGLHLFELHGIMMLRITNENWSKICIYLDKKEEHGIQYQTHPNVDKELFRLKSCIRLKNPTKPFPLNTDVGIIKWRLCTTDEDLIPLLVNCWPSDNGAGGCDVTIEYELLRKDMQLDNVTLHIPLAVGSTAVVMECDGNYSMEDRKNMLVWSLPVIDSTNSSGSMEFNVTSCIPADMYPINVHFVSKTPYAYVKPTEVTLVERNTETVKFSQESICFAEKYEVD